MDNQYTGHDKVRQYFARIIKEDRVPHALLVLGPEGVGQLQLVLEWCCMLYCENAERGSFCGSCKSCQQITNYTHPDLHFAFPVIKHEKYKRDETTSLHFMKEWREFLKAQIHGNIYDWLNHLGADNKTANINVAECNQIIHNLGLKSYSGKYKIQIIWHAESLSKEGNRLLKLIEEPSDDTIIILLANNRNAILNTIQSRCQILRVPAFSDADIAETLRTERAMDEKEIMEISYLAEGNMRKAREMADHIETGFSDQMVDWFRKCYKGDPEELVAMVDSLNNMGRVNLKHFMKYTLHFLREFLAALNVNSTENARLSAREKSVILKMQKILDREKTARLQKLFDKNIMYIDRNLSVKIMLMQLSLKINEILRAEVNKFA